MFLGKILDVSWLDCEQYRKNKCKKKEHKQHSSLFEVLRWPSYYLNVIDPLIIPLIFIFLSCCENAYDNKKFSHENSKPCCESWIMTC